MNELDRWYGDDPPAPEKIIEREHTVVYEVAEEMARAGFPRLYAKVLALLRGRKAKMAKMYLSHCLNAVRRDRSARFKKATADSAVPTAPQVADASLTVADVARRLGVVRGCNRLTRERSAPGSAHLLDAQFLDAHDQASRC